MNSNKEQDEDKSSKIKEIYRYNEMSNKVLKADKNLQSIQSDPLRDAELSHPKSMKGKISYKDMGSSVRQDLNTSEREVAEREVSEASIIKKKEENKYKLGLYTANNSTLLGNSNQTNLMYHPSTEENATIYRKILEKVMDILGDDMPHDVISGTTDVIITTLKKDEDNSDGLVDKKRLNIISELGIEINKSQFSELFKDVKSITDFHLEKPSHNTNEVVTILANSDDEDNEEELNVLEQEVNMEEHGIDEITISKNKAHVSVPQIDSTDVLTISGNGMSFPRIANINNEYLKTILGNSSNSVSAQLLDIISNHQYDEEKLKKRVTKQFDNASATVIDYIITNRSSIYWGLRLSTCDKQNTSKVLKEMREKGLNDLVNEYEISLKENGKRARGDTEEEEEEEYEKLEEEDNMNLLAVSKKQKSISTKELALLDLDTIKFDQGSELMTNTKVKLPKGSFKRMKPEYDEIHIPPPPKAEIDYDLVPITSLPNWARKAFPSGETETLNAVQSKVFPIAFKSDHNILLCAPTGAGKTNVAMLTVLRTLTNYYNESTDTFKLNKFKIVYIAPLKALVQEQVREFRRRLSPYGIKVSELTGDSRLTRQEIENTQILVATPEKWDIVTRKASDNWYTDFVKLLIIDEIHLLHDERGPVLESIVARTLRSNDYVDKPRIIGLSATLPNYTDVAAFLRVPKEGIFYFDASYRPCPLSQQFCGIKVESSLKKINAMNFACYEKVLESLKEGNQVIVFVHSRKETGRTGDYLIKKFIETESTEKLISSEAGSKEILNSESSNILDPNLKKLVTYGIGIHHAGLSREDRSTSEDMFADGLLKVLVSTATLAWGVNLPAHTVIIKGTDIYSPEQGNWVRLSPQDILQMLGRAGRPRYDTHGDGIIITNQSDIQYYLAVLNQQLPIESQLISKVVDNLNAEVVSGNVKSLTEAVDWLSYTYFYVRVLMSPELYKVPQAENDETLMQFRKQLMHTVFCVLAQQNLLVYNQDTGAVIPTELGRIASYFYIKYESMHRYNQELSENASLMDILGIFSLSDEFKYFTIRPEEVREIHELFSRVPIPIKSEIEEASTKVNVLLQAYISNLKLEGFALHADMVFIQQSAGRLIRAMYELCLKKKWSTPTKTLLALSKCVSRKIWVTNSPLRQFSRCPTEVIKKAESSNLQWKEYLSLKSPSEVGHSIRLEKYGKLTYDLLQRFPKVKMECVVQPITPSLLNFQVAVNPEWIWDDNIHDSAEPFLILVEDLSGTEILYSESLIIRSNAVNKEIMLDFCVQLSSNQQKRMPPNIFVSIISEKWLQCQEEIAIRLDDVTLPKKFPATTTLEDMELIETSSLNETFGSIFDFDRFNLIQSNVFETLYNSNENIFIGCSKGSGKTVMAELAILNHWRQNGGRIIYLTPSKTKIHKLTKYWSKKFEGIADGKTISELTDNILENNRILGQSHLTLATPNQFDLLSRKWRQRKNVQRIDLMIFDDIHEMSSGISGSSYEILISRMMFIAFQLEKEQRIVALSSPIANSRDFSEWMGIDKTNIFNFSTMERNEPITIQIEVEEELSNDNTPRNLVNKIFEVSHEQNNSPIIYLPNRRTCINVASHLTSTANRRNIDIQKVDEEQMKGYVKNVKDKQLLIALLNGIGFIYPEMNKIDRSVTEKLLNSGALSFLLVTRDCCKDTLKSKLIIICGTESYNLRDHHSNNYTANEVLEMVGNSTAQGTGNAKVIIYTTPSRKYYYKKFLQEPLPTESFLYFNFHDILINGISNSIIETKQDCVDWLTYTYFYRRIHANPTFYGVKNSTEYGISAYLTELVESTLTDLSDLSLIEVNESHQERTENDEEDDEETISPLNGCLISAYNNVNFITMHSFITNSTKNATLGQLLEILSTANEFENIPLRVEDYAKLLKLQGLLPIKFKGSMDSDSTSFKVFILLQAYFSRIELPFNLKLDLNLILHSVTTLVSAFADVLAGNGFLNATTVMDISQMLTQAVWDVDNPLRQIPYFDENILAKCKEKNVETVYDIMALEDDERDDLLTMDIDKVMTVANFINNYPNIEMKYSMENTQNIAVNELNKLFVTITRDDEPESLSVVSEKFPVEKKEGWWIVVGETSTRELYAMKKVSLKEELNEYQIEFMLPNSGNHSITLWCICDSYVDTDKEVTFEVTVK
ncbi:similar to Saccharomyces cerevisiae YER172C BRR2 RNA-dependent ATPase RNA helicase (DEIH box) [Maudiozyma saulgeensis]|uniref:RNA helicase n=1 Tax=Maudiozyma saulgeensis TaxID=1789683 RepID=A0A1X7R884_9SACH|nr:similar to Saccharomyces cerevisiae YER172C BRR2 RNA-dependent ATPase RNA helicase (DEIH box) [Kazachstania saulgeensis]